MKNPLSSKKVKALEKPAPPTVADMFPKAAEDSLAAREGRNVLAQLGSRRAAELEQYAAARQAQRDAQRAADDQLLDRIYGRSEVAAQNARRAEERARVRLEDAEGRR
jgi:hypothetical protein